MWKIWREAKFYFLNNVIFIKIERFKLKTCERERDRETEVERERKR